jgi:putative transmembrane protein PGPGW
MTLTRSGWDVFKKAIGTWRLFKEIEPGHRFQSRYHRYRRRREQGETSHYGWIVNLIGGPALIVAGFAFLPTPGPSFIIIVIGMWMLAGEFIPLARFFDRLDARQRRLKRWIKGRWTRLHAISKVLAVLVCVVVPGYGAYYFCFGG